MIIETIVSTTDTTGRPNFAPMGIRLEGDYVSLRPFRTTVTWKNLREVGEGVVNATDDVGLFVRCALDSEVPPHRSADAVRGVVLVDVCWWKEFVIESSDLTGEQASFRGRIIRAGRGRDFVGFNRAKHAVIEAAILTTRLHLLDRVKILEEFERLRPLVERTGGADERRAFEYLNARARSFAPAEMAHAD